MSVFRRNGLAICFGTLFLLALVAQAFTGVALYNEEQVTAGLEEISFWQYLASSSFAVDVAENWQSEYLQFLLMIMATVWLVQKGSPESKQLGHPGPETDEEQLVGKYARDSSPAWAKAGGWRTRIYSNSLVLVMGLIFLLSWLVQSIAGFSAYAEQQLANLQEPGTWTDYIGHPEFWNRTVQNWQSEFLAVLSMVVLAIYLRQRGSPESKPVGEAHDTTGIQG